MKVLIGVDPHKASVAVAAIDEAKGELLERASFPHNRTGLGALESWAKRFPERRWAVENAGGLGRHLAGRLSVAGESVVDVPPKLSARVRVLSTGNSRKNDGIDALATALAASRRERLAAVDHETVPEVLRLLSERREDLVAERTRALNRLRMGFYEIWSPVGSPVGWPGRFRPTEPHGSCAAYVPEASPRASGADWLRRSCATSGRWIGRARTSTSASKLSWRLPAPPSPKDLRHRSHTGREDHRYGRGDVTRFPTKSHFASYSGTAPVEASSGKVVRHRLSLAGNRKLNYALHMIAVCQARSDARGGVYYRKKIAEGKSRKEALRCLKRRISDAVFRSLMADSQAPSHTAA